jgi:7-cyano-7-deazaguanine synthase
MNDRAVVLLSGGQDSTTALFWALRRFNVVRAISFDYGQRHAVELDAARKIAELAEVEHVVLTLGDVFEGESPLTRADVDVEQYASADVLPGGLEATFVPGRNVTFLALAGSHAAALDADHLVIGVSQEDFGGYPDCRAGFVGAMEAALREGLGRDHLVINTPLLHLSKRETVELAQRLPGCMEALAHSHTCYRGERPACGRCHACLLRLKGFVEAGALDPIAYGPGANVTVTL